MHIDWHSVWTILGAALGGGFVVRGFNWIKSRGEREESIDRRIKALEKSTDNINQAIDQQGDNIERIRRMARENSEQQKVIEENIKELQEWTENTEQNTEALRELSYQIKKLSDQMNGGIEDGVDTED